MGDAADGDFDTGLDAYLAHKRGECGYDGPCEYCYDEDPEYRAEVDAEFNAGLDAVPKE